MKPSGRIFCPVVFFVLYYFNAVQAIYDPNQSYPVKPAKHRELVIPWYLSSGTTEPPVELQVSGWGQGVETTPRNPVIVNDEAHLYRPQYETSNEEIEQKSITNFDNNHQQTQNTRDNWDFQQIHVLDQTNVNTDQYFDVNEWFKENDENQEPYEDFAIESKKPYKDKKDFTAAPVELVKVAKYDSATGVQCPTSDATGLFVYPLDCKYFVNCWNGRAFIQPCAPGTLFSSETLECDIPIKVKCYSGKSEELTQSHYAPSSAKKKAVITESRSEWVIPETDKNPSCPLWVTGLLPHPHDCTKFLQCANGGTFIMDCGPGTVFNPAVSVCDWPYNVRGCEDALKPKEEPITPPAWGNIDVHGDFQDTTSQSPVQTNVVKCPVGYNGLFPHPSDCNKFLQCNNGNTYVMDCAPGTVFNPVASICDFPYNVAGCGKEKPSVTENSQFGTDLYDHNLGGQTFYEQSGQHETTFHHTTHTSNIPAVSNGQSFHSEEDYQYNSDYHNNHHRNGNDYANENSNTYHRNNPNHGLSNNGHSEGNYNEENHGFGGNEDQNTYVDSNYKLPGEDENLNPTPVWKYEQPTTTEATINPQSWNQEATNIDRPGQFKPSTWRGQDNRDERPSNSHVEGQWLQGSKTFGLNKNTDAASSMTIRNNVLHRNSMINNKTKPVIDIAINNNASFLLHGNRKPALQYQNNDANIVNNNNASPLLHRNRKPSLQYQNNSQALHLALTSGHAVIPNQGYGLEYWRATEGNVDINETSTNVHASGDPQITSHQNPHHWNKIDVTTKFHPARNDDMDYSPGKIESYGHKATDLELDSKLDEWAMKTNVFHLAHNVPGTETRRQGKKFSTNTNAKNDDSNLTDLKNKQWYPNGIYVNVNGIKGHYITKDVEINQGHSQTRQYGNKNGINALGKPNDPLVPTTIHEKPVSQTFSTIIRRPNNQFINQESGITFFGKTTSDNNHAVNKTYGDGLMPVKTKPKLRPIVQNNLRDKPEYIHKVTPNFNEMHPGCNSYENGLRNCTYMNNLTENGRDYHTSDRNTPEVTIEFHDNQDNYKTLNDTSVESTTLDSSILVEGSSLEGDRQDDTNNRQTKLNNQNKTAVNLKESVIMKINRPKIHLDIFGVDVINDKEEPPFPANYMHPVYPVDYLPEDVEISPSSGQVLRLRGGSSLEDGYLEVQGTESGWGIVCDRRNEWTLKEANVVCRQLGYTGGAEMAWQGQNDQGEELRWIAADSVHCFGNETYFQSCKFTHDAECDVARDAVGIRCLSNRVAYCREDEIPHRGFCYHLADSESALNHAEALNYCNNKGSKLLDIINQNENNFISEWLMQKHPDVDSIMTSGFGFTTLNRTLWLWSDSHHARFRFAKWWPGWMSDKKIPPLVGVRPACIIMKRIFPCHNRPDESCTSDYFFWDIEDCAASSKGHSYICKRAYNDIGCVYGKGQHYAGKANVTASGFKCLSWGDESVEKYLNLKVTSMETKDKLKEHNYCRNPNPNREIEPWCFTGSDGQYEHCDIPPCTKQGEIRSPAADQCKPKHFQCTPGECIPSPWICDGEEDCTNGADEHACFQNLEFYTTTKQHRLDGYDVEKWLNTPLTTCALRCKEADFTCRSFSHKTDGNVCLLSDSNVGLTGTLESSDEYDYYEMNERSINCSDMFVCGNRKCINESLVCNGKNNCGDRTDESICDIEHLGYEIRLSGSNNTEEGTLEIKVWGHWGQVCDDGFGMIAANVACKELGFTFGAREVRSAGFYSEGESRLFLMDQVKCRGNETTLRECDFDGWGIHNCLPEEAVGIVCKTAVNICQDGSWKCDNSPECIPTPYICDGVVDCSDSSDEGPEHCEAPFAIRLADGSNRLEGRVEVRHHGIWGTICDDDFSTATATVICNSLGYGGPATAIKNGMFGPGEGPIWLDQVSCYGNETHLYKCNHEHWGRHNCGHDEDAGVRCEPKKWTAPEENDPLVPDLPEIEINDILPADCGMRIEDFDEDDEYIARVVQGSVAPKGAFPWQASLRVRGHSRSSHWCGAVIISPLHVLTAAHCLEGYNKGMYFIRAGDYNTEIDDGTEVEANIEDYYIHEGFRKGQRLNNDIALVLLKGRGIPLGRNIMPICLPPENAEYLPGLNCTISGWGSTESGRSVQSNFLRYGWVPILDQSVCQADYVYGEGAISDGMVCAGYLNEGVDSCDGDSGGPLTCQHNNAFTLYGLTSWGKRCGEPNKPGVYVRIAHYRKWIDQKIQESSTGR